MKRMWGAGEGDQLLALVLGLGSCRLVIPPALPCLHQQVELPSSPRAAVTKGRGQWERGCSPTLRPLCSTLRASSTVLLRGGVGATLPRATAIALRLLWPQGQFCHLPQVTRGISPRPPRRGAGSTFPSAAVSKCGGGSAPSTTAGVRGKAGSRRRVWLSRNKKYSSKDLNPVQCLLKTVASYGIGRPL